MLNKFTLSTLAMLGLSTATHAAILEQFTFDDPSGTLLADAANTANPGNNWSEDATDMAPSAVTATGAYNVVKANDNFGTNFLQTDNFSSGTVWWVMEVAGWNMLDFNFLENEEIRLNFLDNDTGTSGSTVTAALEIERDIAGGLILFGDALGSGTGIAPVSLPLSMTGASTFVLELDKTANTYSIYYDLGAGFIDLGTGDVDPGRDGNSLRFVANNNFGSDGEFFAIDTFTITTTNPIPEPTTAGLALLGLAARAGRRSA